MFSYELFSSETIEFSGGTPIEIDGGFSAGEWTDAKSIKINLEAGGKTTVFYKHDNTNLYFAFCSNLKQGLAWNCPEILFDISNDKSSNWMKDDWWFHVSATDCYSKGVYGDYSTCLLVQEDWKANNLLDSNFKDTVEIIIPFATIGIEPKDSVKFGICLEVTNTFDRWEYWPANSDKSRPSGWAEAVVFFNGTGVETGHTDYDFSILPNPADDFIRLNGEFTVNTRASVYNSSGEFILGISHPGMIDVSYLPEGVYFIGIDNGSKTVIRSFVVSR